MLDVREPENQNFFFTQYFDVVRSKRFPIEAADNALGCLRQFWAHGNLDVNPIAGKYFHLCPLST